MVRVASLRPAGSGTSSGPDVRRSVGGRTRGAASPAAVVPVYHLRFFWGVFLCFNLFGKRLARRFKRRQRMCGVGSFQHGSSSTKNSTAAPCQTILVPDVRQTQRRGGGSSHIRHVPVEIRPLCVCLAQRKEEKKKTQLMAL